jgi:4-coumarate--CoA ligase
VGSIGVLVRNVKARLVVDDDGNVDALPGERGELWVHGPNIMKVRHLNWSDDGRDQWFKQGYLGNKAATEDCITPDGWFKTGDVGILDSDGFFWIVDRKKELIKYKVCVMC